MDGSREFFCARMESRRYWSKAGQQRWVARDHEGKSDSLYRMTSRKWSLDGVSINGVRSNNKLGTTKIDGEAR